MSKLKMFLACTIILCAGIMFAQTNGDYQSKTSGNWSSTGTWEIYDDGWVDATEAPTNSNAGIITISAGHEVTISSNTTADQLVVKGAIVINSPRTLTLSNGDGDDLNINASGSLTVNAGGAFTWSAANITVVNNGTITVNGTMASGPNVMTGSGSFTLASGA